MASEIIFLGYEIFGYLHWLLSKSRQMVSLKMSPRTLELIYDEIIEHMKSDGKFDEIRVNLIKPIWEDPHFSEIIDKFKSECERFCEKVDLNITRNALRTKLASHFETSQNKSGSMVKSHILRLLKERDSELRAKYYKDAREILGKFLPQPESPEIVEDTLMPNSDLGSQQVVDMEIEESPDPERPTWSPIGNDSQIDEDSQLGNENQPSKESQPCNESQPGFDSQLSIDRQLGIDSKLGTDSHPDIGRQHDVDSQPDTDRQLGVDSQPNIDRKPNVDSQSVVDNQLGIDSQLENLSDISDRPEDDSELEKLTFSSVSSVDTADLSDFDNSIKLSDDEANIVGRPKNSKVSVADIADQINDLSTTKVECKQEPLERSDIQEQLDVTESDGVSAESNSGRRVTRARKVNPRYSNEDFTHTPYKR